MPKISKWKFQEACLRGIEKAQNEYEEWSGGRWLVAAPEYMMTVYIAREIWEIPGDKFIDLEYSVSSALRETGARLRGPLPGSMRPDGRSDILISWATSGTPRGIIELKNHADDYKGHKSDLKRICSMLKKGENTNLEFGILSFFSYSHYKNSDEEYCKNKHQEKILKFSNNLLEDLNESFKYDIQYKMGEVDDGWIWGSVAIMIW